MRLGAAGAAVLRQARTRRVETDHTLDVRDRDEQRTVGIAVTQERVDLEHRVGGIARVEADAVVDDSFEDGEGADPHAGMLARGQQLMSDAQESILAGVEQLAAGWVVRTVLGVVDAWGRLDDAARTEVAARARVAGDRGTERVAGALRALFATAPAAQRSTPLELVRTLRFEVTEVLAEAGVPEVERDQFDVRAFPDDVYGIVPRSLADLGDEDLGPALLAWGMGKASVLRAISTERDQS